MALEPDRTQFTDRKVVRRGLLAGLAGFGAAAALKITGAGKATKAEATDGQNLTIGNVSFLGSAQTAQSITTINCSPAFNQFGLLVVNGAVPGLAARSGVGGGSDSAAGAGVYGLNTAAGGAGVWGVGSPGVLGHATASGATAVRGITTDLIGIGLQGVANTTADFTSTGTGAGTGVLGKSGSGPGVRGESNSGAGVFGKSTSQPGVDGVSTSSLGVRGVSTNFVGVVGISSGSHGLYGSSGAAAGIGLVGENTAGGLAGYFFGNVQIVGALQVFGAKNAVIKMQDGTNAAVYCQESPEPYFEDFGRGQLAGGVANVQLEREFAGLVAGSDYMVFLTPGADTRGLFVTHQGPNGFEVRECQGGTSSIPFTYRVVTKRKDIEGKRFARVSDDAKRSVAAARAQLDSTPHGNGNGRNGP